MSAAQDIQHDQAYADDPYAYQDGYDEGAEEPVQKRRGGMVTVVVVLALAVVGTGGSLCLSHLCRIAPQRRAADHQGGHRPDQDRAGARATPAPRCRTGLAAGDGTEKIVPREEAPVDVNAQIRRRAWCFRR